MEKEPIARELPSLDLILEDIKEKYSRDRVDGLHESVAGTYSQYTVLKQRYLLFMKERSTLDYETYLTLDLSCRDIRLAKISLSAKGKSILEKEIEVLSLIESSQKNKLSKLMHLQSSTSTTNKGFYRVYHYEESSSTLFLITDYPGRSVFSLKVKPFSFATVSQIGIQLLKRIKDLHQIGVIHSNLNPNTVLIGRNEQQHVIFLSDFNLSVTTSSAYFAESKGINVIRINFQERHRTISLFPYLLL